MNYSYPAQYGSIKKDKWRLQRYIDLGYSDEQLDEEEHKLWEEINAIVSASEEPLKNIANIPDSQLIGFGWEWSVYTLPSKQKIIKISSGIFPEVNTSQYLENTIHAYKICKKYLADFVLASEFGRIRLSESECNFIKQPFLPRVDNEAFIIASLTEKEKVLMKQLCTRLLRLAESELWLPDVGIHKKENDNWSIRNCMIHNDEVRLFDFTAYYDVYRLHPSRMNQELEIKTESIKQLIEEL